MPLQTLALWVWIWRDLGLCLWQRCWGGGQGAWPCLMPRAAEVQLPRLVSKTPLYPPLQARSSLDPGSTRRVINPCHLSVTEQMHSPQPWSWSSPRTGASPNQISWLTWTELRLVGTGHFVETLASVPSQSPTPFSAFPWSPKQRNERILSWGSCSAYFQHVVLQSSENQRHQRGEAASAQPAGTGSFGDSSLLFYFPCASDVPSHLAAPGQLSLFRKAVARAPLWLEKCLKWGWQAAVPGAGRETQITKPNMRAVAHVSSWQDVSQVGSGSSCSPEN